MHRLVCGFLAMTALALTGVAEQADEQPILDLIGLLPEDPTTYRSLPAAAVMGCQAAPPSGGGASAGR